MMWFCAGYGLVDMNDPGFQPGLRHVFSQTPDDSGSRQIKCLANRDERVASCPTCFWKYDWWNRRNEEIEFG